MYFYESFLRESRCVSFHVSFAKGHSRNRPSLPSWLSCKIQDIFIIYHRISWITRVFVDYFYILIREKIFRHGRLTNQILDTRIRNCSARWCSFSIFSLSLSLSAYVSMYISTQLRVLGHGEEAERRATLLRCLSIFFDDDRDGCLC
jgi:hypothetical protein